MVYLEGGSAKSRPQMKWPFDVATGQERSEFVSRAEARCRISSRFPISCSVETTLALCLAGNDRKGECQRHNQKKDFVMHHTHLYARLACLAMLAAPSLAQNNPSSSNPNNFAGQTGWGLPYCVFAANDKAHGMELFTVSNSLPVTCQVIDIRPGPESSRPREFVYLSGYYYFVASGGSDDVELWRTNGTALGTTEVADINPSGSSHPHQLTVAGGRVFFSALDANGDREIYSSDGTTTARIKDIRLGVTGSNPKNLYAYGSSILFTANDGLTGREPWVSNGTQQGTFLLADVNPGGLGSGARAYTAVGGQVVFSAFSFFTGTELWITDGTDTNTALLKDIEPALGMSSKPGDFLTDAWDGSRAFFAATTTSHGREMWVTDGTPGGTNMVFDVRPGPESSDPHDLAASLFNVWFVAHDGSNGSQIWNADMLGTTAIPLTNIAGINPRDLVPSAKLGRVLFTDENDSGKLWTTSSALGGAETLATFRNGPGNLIVNRNVRSMIAGFPVVFTAASIGNGLEPWGTDGTAAGTKMICDIAVAPPGDLRAELKLHAAPLGSSMSFDIEQGPPSGLGLIAIADTPVPGAVLPGINGTVNISPPLVTQVLVLSATGTGSLLLPIPVLPPGTDLLFATQAFTLDPGGSGDLDATSNGSFGIRVPGIPGVANVSGTFDDKDHRYEVSVDFGSALTDEGHFEFEHVLRNGHAVLVKTYDNSGDGSFFFTGHTPLEDLEFLRLCYVDKHGRRTPLWRSYC